jgi:hypothetical protein
MRLSVTTTQEQGQQDGSDDRNHDRPKTAAPGGEKGKHALGELSTLAGRARIPRRGPQESVDEFPGKKKSHKAKDPAQHDNLRIGSHPASGCIDFKPSRDYHQ